MLGGPSAAGPVGLDLVGNPPHREWCLEFGATPVESRGSGYPTWACTFSPSCAATYTATGLGPTEPRLCSSSPSSRTPATLPPATRLSGVSQPPNRCGRYDQGKLCSSPPMTFGSGPRSSDWYRPFNSPRADQSHRSRAACRSAYSGTWAATDVHTCNELRKLGSGCDAVLPLAFARSSCEPGYRSTQDLHRVPFFNAPTRSSCCPLPITECSTRGMCEASDCP